MIKVLQELTSMYTPEIILHRDSQIQKITEVFKKYKEFGIAPNLLILGVTGSGKTAVISNVLKKQNNSIYGSAAVYRTTFKTLKSMFDIRCNTEGTLIMNIIERLKANPRILVIDEVNKISDIINLFNDVNTIYRETGCPIILITNRRDVIYQMPDDARLTLFFEKIEFPPYNAIELYDIIKQRLDLVKDKIQEVPDGQLRKLCAKVGKDSSARNLLLVTFNCVVANDFSDEYIDKSLIQLYEQDWKDFLINLRPSQKEFLINMLELQTCQKEIKPPELTKLMKDFTPSRISQLISYFEENGVIESRYKNMGRAGGRTRIIKFISEDVFEKIDTLMMEVNQ